MTRSLMMRNARCGPDLRLMLALSMVDTGDAPAGRTVATTVPMGRMEREMATKVRPKTRELSDAEKATMKAAREARAKGESLAAVAWRAASTKADKANLLQAHL